jgi:hypothetical protein
MLHKFQVALAMLCCGIQAAAANCNVAGPPWELASDTVDWIMTIGSGQTCIQGLRRRTTTIDNVSVAKAAEHGAVVIRGSGFEYRASPDYKGTDSFLIALSGLNGGIAGSSKILIRVNVR